MNLIKTKSFELAVYRKGDENSPKLALILPGRLDTKDYPHNLSHVDYLASKGYFAISFDPPGTWESPGSIELYTMTNYLKAINELIEHFGNKPTLLMGHSRGGTVAMVAGTRNDSVTHIIVVMSNTTPSKKGEGKIEDNAEITFRDTPPNDAKNQKRFDLPLNYFEDALQYNPLEALKTCTKPKLFIRGIKDTIINPIEITNEHEQSAEPKEYREVDSEHDYRRHEDIIEEINRIVGEFLDKY